MTTANELQEITPASKQHTDVLDSNIVVTIERVTTIDDLQAGDVLTDGRIVEGCVTGDGGTILSFKPARRLVDCACAYREHDELKSGDELIFEAEGLTRTISHVGGSSAKGTSILFEGEDEARFIRNTTGPDYAIVVR